MSIRGTFRACIQRSQSTTTTHTHTHTHCTGYNAAPHSPLGGLKNRDLHCDAIGCPCDARSPVERRCGAAARCERTERRVKSWEKNGASCIINMDGHLPCWFQRLCVSIPLRLQCKQVRALLSTDFCRTTHQCNPTAERSLYCGPGSPSVTTWLTAANTPSHLPKKTWNAHTHKHNTPASLQPVRAHGTSCLR